MALVFLSVSTLLIVLTNVNDATPAPTIRIQDILSCGITYDDFNTIDGWTKSDFETSYLSGSQKYHGFWDGSPTNGFTKLTREYKTTTTTEITIYFTFIWGCTADYVGTINNNIAMSDYGIVDIDIVNGYNGNIKNVTHLLAINTTLGYSNFPTYGYTDPLLWNIPFCDSSLLTDWREHGKIMDGFITFSINANQIFEVDFAVTMTDEKPDEFWGVTNIAIVGHACSKSLHSQITINNIWIDDLVYDNINGWSLPNLVLWNDANNGNKYHGWFYHDIIQQTLSLNRTFFCNQKANINVTFRYIFAGHWDETYYVNVFIDNNLKQTFNLNSSDNIHYPRVTDEFVTTYIDYRSTGYFTAYEYRVIIDDIIVDAYQDFTLSINTFLGNHIGYRAFWGIADFEISASIPPTDTPTNIPTLAPITITPASAIFTVIIQRISTIISSKLTSVSVIRSKLTLSIYEYFNAYRYSVDIISNIYDSINDQTIIVFEVKKGGFAEWSDSELTLIFSSQTAATLYGEIAKNLEIKWLSHASLVCVSSVECDYYDLFIFMNSGNVTTVLNAQNLLMTVDLNADDVKQPNDKDITTTDIPTNAPTVPPDPPCIIEIKYDVLTTIISITFDINTNYGGLTTSFECKDLIDSMDIIGNNALCQWISPLILNILIGNDNILIQLHNANNNPQIILKTGVIAIVNDDTNIQNDINCLKREVIFVNDDNLSQFMISASIDGDIKATICNILYYTSIGCIGNYGTNFEYLWSIYW
eukprot:320927_1